MSKPLTKPLESGSAYVRHCKNHDNTVKWGYSGDHFTVYGPDGRATICDNHRELKPWLRKRIMLELIAIGLGIYFVIFILRSVA